MATSIYLNNMKRWHAQRVGMSNLSGNCSVSMAKPLCLHSCGDGILNSLFFPIARIQNEVDHLREKVATTSASPSSFTVLKVCLFWRLCHDKFATRKGLPVDRGWPSVRAFMECWRLRLCGDLVAAVAVMPVLSFRRTCCGY